MEQPPNLPDWLDAGSNNPYDQVGGIKALLDPLYLLETPRFLLRVIAATCGITISDVAETDNDFEAVLFHRARKLFGLYCQALYQKN